MGRKTKYSKEEKIKACTDYLSGKESFRSIAKNIGTAHEVVRRWYLTYKIHGESAFESVRLNSSYSSEFKHSVIAEYLSGKYSLPDLGAKYNISSGIIHGWLNKDYNGIEIKDYDPKGNERDHT